MARIYVSGHNDEAMAAPGADMRDLIDGLDLSTDGRIFYLTYLSVANEHATETSVFELADQAEAAITAANQRGAPIHIGPGDSVVVTFPDGAMPFVTNISGAVTSGTVAALSVFASGYLA
jgi:hypothetical protein